MHESRDVVTPGNEARAQAGWLMSVIEFRICRFLSLISWSRASICLIVTLALLS